MKIKKDSPLRNIPAYDKRTVLILDSVRFCYEIIEHSHEKLKENLLITSKMEGKKKIPESFLYVWNIIDHSQRLTKIIQNLSSESNHVLVKEIAEEIRLPRNTYQHMDERIDECFISKEIPFFGKLKWVYSPIDTDFHQDFIAISGSLFSTKNNFVVGEYTGDSIISNIVLETSDRHDSFRVDVSKVFQRITNFIEQTEFKMERDIKDQGLQKIDRSSFTDVVFALASLKNKL